MFATGRVPAGGGIIPIRASKDLRKWTFAGAVFDKLPEWCTRDDAAGGRPFLTISTMEWENEWPKVAAMP